MLNFVRGDKRISKLNYFGCSDEKIQWKRVVSVFFVEFCFFIKNTEKKIIKIYYWSVDSYVIDM